MPVFRFSLNSVSFLMCFSVVLIASPLFLVSLPIWSTSIVNELTWISIASILTLLSSCSWFVTFNILISFFVLSKDSSCSSFLQIISWHFCLRSLMLFSLVCISSNDSTIFTSISCFCSTSSSFFVRFSISAWRPDKHSNFSDSIWFMWVMSNFTFSVFLVSMSIMLASRSNTFFSNCSNISAFSERLWLVFLLLFFAHDISCCNNILPVLSNSNWSAKYSSLVQLSDVSVSTLLILITVSVTTAMSCCNCLFPITSLFSFSSSWTNFSAVSDKLWFVFKPLSVTCDKLLSNKTLSRSTMSIFSSTFKSCVAKSSILDSIFSNCALFEATVEPRSFIFISSSVLSLVAFCNNSTCFWRLFKHCELLWSLNLSWILDRLSMVSSCSCSLSLSMFPIWSSSVFILPVRLSILVSSGTFKEVTQVSRSWNLFSTFSFFNDELSSISNCSWRLFKFCWISYCWLIIEATFVLNSSVFFAVCSCMVFSSWRLAKLSECCNKVTFILEMLWLASCCHFLICSISPRWPSTIFILAIRTSTGVVMEATQVSRSCNFFSLWLCSSLKFWRTSIFSSKLTITFVPSFWWLCIAFISSFISSIELCSWFLISL